MGWGPWGSLPIPPFLAKLNSKFKKRNEMVPNRNLIPPFLAKLNSKFKKRNDMVPNRNANLAGVDVQKIDPYRTGN